MENTAKLYESEMTKLEKRLAADMPWLSIEEIEELAAEMEDDD